MTSPLFRESLAAAGRHRRQARYVLANGLFLWVQLWMVVPVGHAGKLIDRVLVRVGTDIVSLSDIELDRRLLKRELSSEILEQEASTDLFTATELYALVAETILLQVAERELKAVDENLRADGLWRLLVRQGGGIDTLEAGLQGVGLSVGVLRARMVRKWVALKWLRDECFVRGRAAPFDLDAEALRTAGLFSGVQGRRLFEASSDFVEKMMERVDVEWKISFSGETHQPTNW